MKKFRKNLIGAVCAAALVCTAGGAALWTNTEKASATDAGVLVNYDFSENVDTAFAAPASNYGWKTTGSKLKPNFSFVKAAQIGYLNQKISLNESKYISLDFYAKEAGLDIGLLSAAEMDAGTWWTTSAVSVHCYYLAQHLTNSFQLTKGLDGGGWLGDYTANSATLIGTGHKLEIISNGSTLTIKLDGVQVYADIAIPAEETYLVFRAGNGTTAVDSWIDNLYVADSAPTASEDGVTEYSFETATPDVDFTALAVEGWGTKNGVFAPKQEGAKYNASATKWNQALDLTQDRYISFDFYSAGETEGAHFDVGFLSTEAENVWGTALFAHIPSADGVFSVTGNVDVGEWKGGVTVNYADGFVHTMEITVKGGKISFKIDGVTPTLDTGATEFDIPSNEAYLVFRAVGRASYIDNLYIADSAPAESANVSVDFDGYVDFFKNFNGSYTAKNGVYTPNAAWNSVSSVEKIDLTSVEEISLDFNLTLNETYAINNDQFHIGLFPNADPAVGAGEGKSLAFRYVENDDGSIGGEVWWSAQFGGFNWISSIGGNYYDEMTHTVQIKFADGKMTVWLDGKETSLTTAIPADEAYLMLSATNTASYVDNLSIKYKEVETPKYDLTIQDLAGETVTTIEDISGEFTIPEYLTAQGKVFLGYLVGNQLFQAGDVVVINQALTITAIEATFAMVDGASIRIDAPTGMRFTTTLTWDAYEAISSFASFGTLIAKAEDVAADYADLTTAFDGTYLNIEQTKYQEKNGNFQFNGVLVNIKDNHHNWNFASRAYMTVTYTDGDEVTFYTNGETRSVDYIAKKAFLDREDTQQGDYIHYIEEEKNYSKYTDDQLDTLYKFCKDVLESDTAEAYVSTQGNDTNSGYSTRSAVATIARALEIVEGQENATVYLLDGEYEISETVEIPANVTVESLSGNALLSGASKVSATEIVEKTDAKLGRVWEIPCKKKTINCM